MARTSITERLPEFPWDSLADVSALAHQHPDGVVDLSIGTPVDEVAPGIQLALSSAAAQPGYPPTTGTSSLRAAIASWLNRRYGAAITPEQTLACIGTKEAIATLPLHLGFGAGDKVVIPEIAYPTYEVAARMAGATPLRSDDIESVDPAGVGLIFINSPSNPTGEVIGLQRLREIVAFARRHDIIVAADECYIGLDWDAQPISILDERVCDRDHTGLLALHSLSKSSNMASYRTGFIAGDKELIAELTTLRKHLGLMVPGPTQHAMIAALEDDDQEALQKLRYARRRAVLIPALLTAGLRIDHSQAGLYLWATRGENGRETLRWLAEYGILAAPGDFYGPHSHDFVRISVTAPDERIQAAATRLAGE